ncbi:MAG: response regulator [Phycisphaeraceae bacterium]
MRVLLADDRQMMREGLRALLEKHQQTEVVGEAEDGRAAVALAAELKPDVVIMDVTMPGLNGIEATKQILRDHPRTKVLALSVHADRRYALTMLEAGAVGYLVKNSAAQELYRALEAVNKGQTYLSPDVAQVLVDSYRKRQFPTDKAASEALTDREREVLQLLAEGMTSKQIALQLHLSVATVDTHRRQIMNKLNLHGIAELTKYAIREGLTGIDP